MIQPLDENDVGDVAQIHLKSLKGAFLSELGIDFLVEVYYGILRSKHAVCYVYREKSKVVGFIAGTRDTKKFFRDVFRMKGLRFASIIIVKALKKPKIVYYGMQSLLYPSTSTDVDGELLSIAVLDESRNKGVGKKLVERLNDYFKDEGIKGLKVTVEKDNVKANRFYKKMGFRYSSAFTLYGREMNLYVYGLDD